jgi:hypothetical protein
VALYIRIIWGMDNRPSGGRSLKTQFHPWVTFRPRFTPGGRAPGTHWRGGWVGLRAGLDTKTRGRILLSLPGTEPRSSGRLVCSQTLHWLSYPGSLEVRDYWQNKDDGDAP